MKYIIIIIMYAVANNWCGRCTGNKVLINVGLLLETAKYNILKICVLWLVGCIKLFFHTTSGTCSVHLLVSNHKHQTLVTKYSIWTWKKVTKLVKQKIENFQLEE